MTIGIAVNISCLSFVLSVVIYVPFYQEKLMTTNPYEISPTELKSLLDEGKDIQLIDVRTLAKHQDYNIGGMHIPSDELPMRLNEISKAKPIVTYCTSGGRSMRALEFLLSAGFADVKSLAGGVTLWKAMQL